MDTSHMIRKSKISNFGSPVGGLAGRQLSVTCWNNLTYFIFPNHVNIYCLHFLCSFSFLYCCLFQWKFSTRRNMLHLDFSRNLETFLSCIIFLGFLITIGCWKEIAQGQQYLLGREYECRPNCALNYRCLTCHILTIKYQRVKTIFDGYQECTERTFSEQSAVNYI